MRVNVMWCVNWYEIEPEWFLCFSLCRFCELCKHRFEFAPSKSLSLSLLLFLSLSLIFFDPSPPLSSTFLTCIKLILSLSPPVYRHDMPQRLPLSDIIGGITWGTVSSLRRWCHLGFVGFMWLILVPICICECHAMTLHHTSSALHTCTYVHIDLYSITVYLYMH